MQLAMLGGNFRQLFPHRFRFWTRLQALEERDRSGKIFVFHRGPEFDQSLIQSINRLLVSFVNDHFRFSVFPEKIDDVAFDRDHRHLIGSFNVVPNTQIVAILRNDDVALRDPLNVAAVVDQRLLAICVQIVQVQFVAFVTEQQLLTGFVKLIQNVISGEPYNARGGVGIAKYFICESI